MGAINERNEISFKDLVLRAKGWFQYLFSKWILIIGFSFIGSVVGITYALLKSPIYVAVTSFVLEESEKGGALSQYAGLASMVGIDIGGGSNGLFQGDNILQLYKSRSMLKEVLFAPATIGNKQALLIEHYIDYKKLREKWSNKPRLKNIRYTSKTISRLTRLQDSILTEVVDDLNKKSLIVYKPDKKGSIINVEVRTISEEFSKLFNDQLVKTVNDFYVRTKTKKALENLKILQHQTDSVRNVLNGAIYEGASVVDATPNLNPTRQILRTPVQKSQFSAEANKAILSNLIQNLEISKLSLRQETPLIQIIDEPVFPLFKDKPSKIVSILVGGILAGFFMVIYLVVKKLINDVLN